MADKVQKIREEVERLHNEYRNKKGAFYFRKALRTVLFIIDSLQEELVSESLEKALAEEWQGYVDRGAATVDALEDNTQELAFAKGFYRGAKWQKQQDQSIVELAEDHAMLAGMEKMKEQMMKDVVEVCIVSSFGPVLDMPNSHIRGIHCTYEEKESTPALFVGDKVKMIIIKEE